MYVHEIADYARVIADDPDQVMLSQARLATMLKIAYKRFRGLVPSEVYEIKHGPTVVAGVVNIDLNNIIFGATPTAARAQKITRVQLVDATTGVVTMIFTPMSSMESLGQSNSNTAAVFRNVATKWWLDGRVLRFSVPVSGSLEVWYLPDESVNWTAGVVMGSNVYVDDLDRWHDIVSLMAIGDSYAMADGAMQATVKQTLSERVAEMRAFFAESRSGQASRYVSEDFYDSRG
jgi:hypothetical protein